ncbi:hypothetical protein BKM31_23975 [[Actinomadura] parvosata subsp. kistnae]|uniref:Uncharacterized protein n=1 Tax=[Actinomadura] parvosata subsp. kistnae TaxID=1909395 RepID=A0A1V0A1N2_9ACTN|nr:hypothetical protein BKM31_23975 [Nonomuraea sp. ATCC 55076]
MCGDVPAVLEARVGEDVPKALVGEGIPAVAETGAGEDVPEVRVGGGIPAVAEARAGGDVSAVAVAGASAVESRRPAATRALMSMSPPSQAIFPDPSDPGTNSSWDHAPTLLGMS